MIICYACGKETNSTLNNECEKCRKLPTFIRWIKRFLTRKKLPHISNGCPYCKNDKFILGPEAGIMQNIKCSECQRIMNLDRLSGLIERI